MNHGPIVDGYEYHARIVLPDGTILDEYDRPRSRPRWSFWLALTLHRRRHPGCVGELYRRPVGSADEWQLFDRRVPEPVEVGADGG